MKDQMIERFLTGVLIAGCLVVLLLFAGRSMEFQHTCEAACGGMDAMTPVVGGEEVCFCEARSGIWIRMHLPAR